MMNIMYMSYSNKPKRLRASAGGWSPGSDDGRPTTKERLKGGKYERSNCKVGCHKWQINKYMEVYKMKRKTYSNVIKASKLIMKKGYEQKESQEMALRIFENMEQLNNGMSAEWFIEKIAPKNYFMEV